MAVKALLLSAGLGTRLRPYTLSLPKPCIPFWGLPMMYYSFYLLKQTACRDIAINLHHLPEKIKELTAAQDLRDFNIQFSYEKDKPYGSGGALYYAKDLLKGCSHFFAINSDEVMIPSTPDILNRLYKHHTEQKALATLLVTDHPDLMKTLKPVWVNGEGVVRGFGEKPSTTENLKPVHYVGYKIFDQKVLELIPPGETHIFHDVVVPAMKKGEKVCTVHDNGTWWETGNLNSLIQAMGDVITNPSHQDYIRKVYKEFQRPYNFETDVNKDYKMAKDKSINTSSLQLKDIIFLDKGSLIAPQSELQNVIIGAGARTGSLHQQMLLPGESQ